MTQDEFREFMSDVIVPQLAQVRSDGQKEYAHDDDNAFANFDRLSERLGIPREKILWIYLTKHIDGILAHLNGHRSQREPVQGRCKDAIMYLCLLWGMVEEGEINIAARGRLDSAISDAGCITHGVRNCPSCFR
jgi:hypothetical protein